MPAFASLMLCALGKGVGEENRDEISVPVIHQLFYLNV